jgi:hypothetical protein
MDFIEGQGAVSDEVTSVRLAISEAGWPITRETRGHRLGPFGRSVMRVPRSGSGQFCGFDTGQGTATLPEP